ncbi:MAG: hypothetical protein C0618_05065 [Desulfuromonas sp.]|nr:MAG: hypothetical protein C0618_05065 [Desulfuromonas sp.]
MSNDLNAHEMVDQELVEAVKQRLDSNRKALHDLKEVTRKLEEINGKLQESEALKSHFLSNIRNEINNPLTSIMGLSRQLATSGGPAETTAAIGQMIYQEAFGLDFQLQNIFIAAELEAGEASPSYALVDMSSLMRTVVDLHRHKIDQKQMIVEESFPADLSFVTDAQHLQIVLMNLLDNALEFCPQGSHIKLSAGMTDSGMMLSVEDSGDGIAADELVRVFDRFRQLEMGTTKSHRGHGLGLSISKALMDLMDGTISLNSEQGKGSIVELFLPEPCVDVHMSAQDSNVFLFDEPEEF